MNEIKKKTFEITAVSGVNPMFTSWFTLHCNLKYKLSKIWTLAEIQKRASGVSFGGFVLLWG